MRIVMIIAALGILTAGMSEAATKGAKKAPAKSPVARKAPKDVYLHNPTGPGNWGDGWSWYKRKATPTKATANQRLANPKFVPQASHQGGG
jgi:hypothetical protein